MTNKVIDNVELEKALDELLESMVLQALAIGAVSKGDPTVQVSTILLGLSFSKVCKVAGVDYNALANKYKEELNIP